MDGLRFIGWHNLWSECADCGLMENPAFRILNDLTKRERRVCERCFMRLFDLTGKGNGIL